MRYTEALEAIYQDHAKVFHAFVPGGFAAYKLDGSDHFITMSYLSIDEPVNFLSYRMMELDWKEVKEDEND